MASELLERMRRNPAGDWRIQDVEAVCREHGVLFRAGALRIVMPSIQRRDKY
jgi:hypothetical protein